MHALDYAPSPDLVRPDYTIHDYHNGIFKVVKFRSTLPRLVLPEDRKKKGNDFKLDSAISRARKVVLELALCNDWDYFCTFTISKDKYDRNDLITWRDSFTQWIRDQRKKGIEVQYVLVPEHHKDGSWHAHGLFKGNMPLVSFADLRRVGVRVPDRLVNNGYYNWVEYQKKFGFCSFAIIKCAAAAAFYVTKYLTKDVSDNVSQVGLHLYYCSRGLQRSRKHGDIYGEHQYLDNFLTNKYDFCSTGMTHVSKGLDWTFALDYMMLEPLSFDDQEEAAEIEADTYMEAVQTVLDGFTDYSVP